MAAKTYKIVQIDTQEDIQKLTDQLSNNSHRSSAAFIDFKVLLNNTSPHHSDNLFCLKDDFNRELSAAYCRIIKQMRMQNSCGYFTFINVHTLGHDSLIVDPGGLRVFIGQMLNWSREYFNWWIENSNLGFVDWESEDSFSADFGEATYGFHEGVLMNSPGYAIFGHWLGRVDKRLQP